MPDDIDILLRGLIGGDPASAAEILDRATTASAPRLLVAAALISRDPQELLARAERNAVTTRDRQLLAVAVAHLNDRRDVLDVLVREHLSDFPENIIVAWIAAEHVRPGPPRSQPHSQPHNQPQE
jgi:hypothetical protein